MPQWCKSTTIPEAVQLFQPTSFLIADFKAIREQSNRFQGDSVADAADEKEEKEKREEVEKAKKYPRIVLATIRKFSESPGNRSNGRLSTASSSHETVRTLTRSISYEFCHVVEASTPADELLKIMYACGGWLGSNSRANAFPLGREVHTPWDRKFLHLYLRDPKTMDAVKKYLLFLLDWYEDGKNPAVDWLSLLRQFSPELCDGNFHRVSFARNKDCPPLHLIRLSEEKPDPAGKLPRSSIFADITRIIFEIAASPVLVIARLHNSLQSQPFWKIITEAAPDRYSDSEILGNFNVYTGNHDTEFLANVRLAIIFGCLMRKDGRNFTFPDDAGGGGGGGGGGGSEGDSGGSGGSSEGNSEGNSGSNEGNGDGGGGGGNDSGSAHPDSGKSAEGSGSGEFGQLGTSGVTRTNPEGVPDEVVESAERVDLSFSAETNDTDSFAGFDSRSALSWDSDRSRGMADSVNSTKRFTGIKKFLRLFRRSSASETSASEVVEWE
ncbi:hypothetical protein BDP27DRAFT_1374408 [Rhodocollybia butyracea]|uniref:Uncharacterized protein n=1 Tax=Rhodocollybia butyracea TaxID=206335 RepID=A0A9P5TVG8_9AGAR|nr:hypothetical protein BDP27DRAFT_1374408 [Rhodocollybia butyracea]